MKDGIVGLVFPVEGTREELEKAVNGLGTVNYIDIWANFLQMRKDGSVNRGKKTIYGTETVLKMLKKTDIEEIKIKVWQEDAYSNGHIYQMTYSKAIIKASDNSIFSNALNFWFFRKHNEGVLQQWNYRINDRKATLRQFMELKMEEVVVFDLDGPPNGPDITTVIVYTEEQEVRGKRGRPAREAKRRKAEEELARTYPAHYARLVAIGAIEDSSVLELDQLKRERCGEKEAGGGK